MRSTRTTALMASTALAAGLLGPVVPAAIGVASAAAVPVLPGIETAGPIPTAAAPVDPAWPVLPVSLAQMPRGTVANPASPYLSVPALRAAAEVPVRVVDLTTGTSLQVWDGTLSRGWTRIGATLSRGHEYRVQVLQANGSWGTVGSFLVSAAGGGGPVAQAGAMAVSAVTGQVLAGWQSRMMAGPVGRGGVGLTWTSGGDAQVGLPAGWRMSVNTVPWARLDEFGTEVATAAIPGVPVAVRAPSAATASLTLKYPSTAGRWVSRFVVQRKNGTGPWATVPVNGLVRGAEQVTGTIAVPRAGEVRVRVGAAVGRTTLWGPSAVVVPSKDLVSVIARSPRPLTGARSRSLLTPGTQPPVVRVTGWDGSLLTFTRNGLGVYEQVGQLAPGFTTRLAWVSDGVWELTDTQGVTTRFSGGRVASVSSKGTRLASVAWDAQGRVTTVTNEIGRVLSLRYAGDVVCPSAGWDGSGFADPPAGLLCRLEYPDGSATDIGYVQAGVSRQIALFKDPGNTGLTLGWDRLNRLVASRSAVVSRAATLDPAAGAVVDRLVYGTDARVATIIHAPAEVGGDQATETIDYPTITDSVLRAYDADPSPTTAVAARTHLDAGPDFGDLGTRYRIDPITSQTLQETNPAGLLNGVSLSRTGTMPATVDATGRVTTFAYDELGNVTGVSGPVADGAAGPRTTTTYDTRRTATGTDVPLSGLRALIYAGTNFAGAVTARYLAADPSRGGLSAVWSGQPAEFSAQAAGVWNPSDADDAAGRAKGWQFLLTASGGTDAEMVVGGTACAEGSLCTITGLPTGPKDVSVQFRRAGRDGWFQVLAAPLGEPLAVLASSAVRPGYGLTTVNGSNDDLPGGPLDGSQTLYDFADPANPRPTSVVAPGSLTTAFAYEAGASGGNDWGRLTSSTTPGGKVSTTAYWDDDVDAALPAVCGGETVRQSGQVKDVVRTDGVVLRTWYDISGRIRATSTIGDGDSLTSCLTHFADGTLATSSQFDGDGTLIERATVDPLAGGDPLATTVTVEHGPAAPVNPGSSVTTSLRTNLAGQVVWITGRGGQVTTTEYDVLGDVTSQTTTPPAGSGATAITSTFEYQPVDGLLSTVRVNGVLAASLSYDGATGRLVRVGYPNSVSAAAGYLPTGAIGTVSVRTGTAELGTVVESRTLSAYGRVQSSVARTTGTSALRESRGYQYDAAGRLASAVIATTGGSSSASTSFGYGYGAQSVFCPAGYLGAGKDGVRTSGRVNGAAYVVCHDSLGRLTSTASPLVTGGGAPATATHDGLGRLLTLGGSRPLTLTWGGTGTPAVIDEADGNGDHRITTTLDTYGGAVLDQTVTSDAGTRTVRNAGPFRVVVESGTVTGTEGIQYALPGGAIVNTAPGATATLTLPGVDGSALVTVEVPALGSGANPAPGPATGLSARFGPYGEPLTDIATDTASALPAYTWKAATGRQTLSGTSSITVLPARAYSPLLGEFLSPDPVADSANNLYAYTDGDPVNQSDPSGGETSDSTSILSGIGAFAGLVAAFGGGFLAGKLKGWKSFLAGTLSAAGVVGSAAGAYAAAKSQQSSDDAAIGYAVGAALLSGIGAVGGYKWGVKRSRTAATARQPSVSEASAVQTERAPSEATVPMVAAPPPVTLTAQAEEAITNMAGAQTVEEVQKIHSAYKRKFHPQRGGDQASWDAVDATLDQRKAEIAWAQLQATRAVKMQEKRAMYGDLVDEFSAGDLDSCVDSFNSGIGGGT